MPEIRPGSWHWRLLVAEAMVRLVLARMLVALVPLRHWRHLLGLPGATRTDRQPDPLALVLAAAVERGARRLPVEAKCLPRAIALHTMLLRRGRASTLVIAAAGPDHRGEIESLHAWVESGRQVVIGEIDVPFHPIVRFG